MDQKTEIKNNTEQLLKTIQEKSKKIDTSNKEKLNKNLSLKIDKDSFKSDFLKSDNVKRITINNESNTASLNLYNHFVMAVMGDLYKSDFGQLKNSLTKTSEMIVFNSMVNEELNKTPEPFLKAL